MKFFIFLISIAIAHAEEVKLNGCEGVLINNISYDKEVLHEHVNQPYQLAIDYSTNNLYFSYSVKGGFDFEIGQLNLKTKQFDIIKNIEGGFANAVDDTTQTVYFGGTDGIYKLDKETLSAIKLNITDKNIWQMFYKDGLYFSTYPDVKPFVYKQNKLAKISQIKYMAMLIAVDKADNIFFSNSSGIFVYKKENQEISRIAQNSIQNGFTKDINGKLYFSTPVGFYTIEDNFTVKIIAKIKNMYGVAIESDGSFVYSSDNSIIRLKSTGKVCSTVKT